MLLPCEVHRNTAKQLGPGAARELLDAITHSEEDRAALIGRLANMVVYVTNHGDAGYPYGEVTAHTSTGDVQALAEL